MFQTEKAHLLFFVGAALMFKVQFLQAAGCHQQWICAIITHLTKWWQACWSPPWSSCRRPCSSRAGRTPWLPSPKLPSAQVSWDWYMIWYGSMMAVMAVFRCQLVVQRWQKRARIDGCTCERQPSHATAVWLPCNHTYVRQRQNITLKRAKYFNCHHCHLT